MTRDYLMIVEDDEDIRDNLALLLQLKGYDVATAGHGREALDMLEQTDCPPCLIILDLMMPVMDGWQLREKLRKDSVFCNVPVVLLSGVADVTRAARDLDAVDHLRKPIDFAKLYRIIDTHC